MLPEGVVAAGEAAPEAADAGGDAQGGTVESFKDFPENVDVVVDGEVVVSFVSSRVLHLHAFLVVVEHHGLRE